MTDESFELFKLRGLLSRLRYEDAQIVRDAIDHIAELERDAARDREIWSGITLRSLEEPAPFGRGIDGQKIVK